MFRGFAKYGLVLVLIALVLAGCAGGGRAPAAGHEVTGTVVATAIGLDGDSEDVPLIGATVKLGSRSTTTGPNGTFKLTGVASGTHEVTASLDGYEGQSKRIDVQRDLIMDPITLTPTGGTVGVSGTEFADLDGTQEDSVIVIRGNVNDFEFSQSVAAAMSVAYAAASTPGDTTAITVEQLQALINGTIHEIQVETDGSFQQELPIDPGSNTIQLRVFDDAGDAYTTPIVRVTSTLERLDLRVLMKWDTDDSDVDIHMFKREPEEVNPAGRRTLFSPWSPADSERHVGYYNHAPTDFGDGEAQNPFLDIDDTSGYGPETIVLQEATPGYYHIWVHFYDIREAGPTNVTVDVILNEPGRNAPLQETFTKKLTEDWEYWYVGTVAYPEGKIIRVEPTDTSGGD